MKSVITNLWKDSKVNFTIINMTLKKITKVILMETYFHMVIIDGSVIRVRYDEIEGLEKHKGTVHIQNKGLITIIKIDKENLPENLREDIEIQFSEDCNKPLLGFHGEMSVIG